MKLIKEMTFDERVEVSNRKWKELLEWRSEKSEEIYEHLKKRGIVLGLDGNVPEYEALKKEFYKRFDALKEKYFGDLTQEEIEKHTEEWRKKKTRVDL